ncbi:hypothetical protein [Pedobacter sp. SYSU D00535]|uniref:hypothetical protein n=1 Tax=Pedobacter sp. SYSU D00535 TaxID=2810308 RepID=UPI001A972375|nr:hypothetical protein [Pedobacter sp. SYSU D00535]
MKKLNYLLFALSTLFVFSSCRDKDDPEPIVHAPETIPNNITTNMTLTSDRTWVLYGETHVKSGAVLTIQPGTVIKSDITQKGSLVIDKGARIEAVGTATQPIVFTSGRPAGNRLPGDWGGLVIIGRAPTNRTSVGPVEGGVAGEYGLDNIPNDNSGTLKYVRVEYAGVSVAQGSEVNAISFYAVGSGTTLDHVQVSYAKDDAFEFFGGTVNGKHLISYGTSDDDFDFDNGYTGKLQFGIVLRRPELADPNDQGNGIEADNESTVPATGPSQPNTRFVMSNFTILGSNGAAGEHERQWYAMRLRRAVQFSITNSVIAGFKEGGMVLESSHTATAYNNGTSVFRNNVITALKQTYFAGDAAATGILSSAALQTKAEADGNATLANAAALNLVAPFNLTAPNFRPQTGSPALQGTWVAPDNSGFFTQVNYRGAVSANDTWLDNWTNFNPGNTTY